MDQESQSCVTDSAPAISIVIPAHGRPEYLQTCLASVRSQGFADYEIIVVDDGSSSELRLAAGDADRYIRLGINVGPAFARNLGALNCRGRILLFLDTDAELRSDTLIQLPALFDSDPLLGVIGGSGPPDSTGTDVEFIAGKSYDSFGRSAVTKYRPSESSTGLHDCAHVEAAFLAVRRVVFEKIGGFDPYWGYMGEDRDLCIRIRDAGYRVVACLDTRAIHRSLGVKSKSDQSRANFVKFFQTKCLEVALKRDGVGGGMKWLLGNHRAALRPSHIPAFAKAFSGYSALKARRTVNHLTPSSLDEYYGAAACEELSKRLSTDLRYPLRSPRNIVFFVNAVCNALCDHCFIIHEGILKQDQRQLPRDRVVQTMRSLNAPVNISLTGGEPFMRKDLGDLLGELVRLPQTRGLGLFSNGSMPPRIENVCRETCERGNTSLYLQLSLDGLEVRHDAIRKIPSGFRKVLETCELSRRLSQEFAQFSFVVAITVMKQNLAEIEPLVDELEGRGYPSKLSIARGNSFSTFGVPADILDGEVEPNQDVSLDLAETEATFRRISAKHPNYFGPFQEKKLRIMLDTLKSKQREFDCHAGYEDAVIYNDGSVAICEQVVPFGNLESWDWDFGKAWNSIQAMEHRLKLTDCACIHGCNISTSISMGASHGGLLGAARSRTARLVSGLRPKQEAASDPFPG